MLRAVFSDVHGNLLAFQAMLADVAGDNAAEMICLGDTIGYGPRPEECVREMITCGASSVLGNHEAAATRHLSKEWFNPPARSMLDKTARMLSTVSKKFMSDLPRHLERPGAFFVHGFPPDSTTAYLFMVEDKEILTLFARQKAPRIFFVGHTHEWLLLLEEDGEIRRRKLGQGVHALPRDRSCIVNVGSVGQPRDGDARAGYCLWDDHASTIEVRRMDYDRETTAREIETLGFSQTFADRVRRGY